MDVTRLNEKGFIVPSDVSTRELLEKVDTMTKFDLQERFGFHVVYAWQCNTVAYITLETILYQLLNSMKMSNNVVGKGMELGDILIIKATNKVDDDAEKAGNINVAFIPSKRVFEILKNEGKDDYASGELMTAENIFDIEDEDLNNIDKFVNYALSKTYNMTLSTKAKFISLIILYTFLENIVRLLYNMYVEELENGTDETALVSLNFNDFIELHCTTGNDGGPMISIRPGVMAKLNIKSDDVTEEE